MREGLAMTTFSLFCNNCAQPSIVQADIDSVLVDDNNIHCPCCGQEVDVETEFYIAGDFRIQRQETEQEQETE